jgi:glycosyltransferase involved in cell wall biosynthesis
LKDIEYRVNLRIGNSLVAKTLTFFMQLSFRFMFKLLPMILLVSHGGSDFELLKQFKADFNIADDKIALEEHPYLSAGKSPKKPEDIPFHILNDYALCFGFFRKDKGFHIAVQASSFVKDQLGGTKLLIVGPALDLDGIKYLNFINRLITEFNMSDKAFIFSRFFSSDEIQWLCLNSKFIILPYTFLLGPSGTAMEAELSGVPIIATKIPSLMSQFRKRNIIWCEPEAQSMADAILEAKNIRKTSDISKIEIRNTLEEVNEKLLQIYLKLAGVNNETYQN